MVSLLIYGMILGSLGYYTEGELSPGAYFVDKG
jgi:hypothetical protein